MSGAARRRPLIMDSLAAQCHERKCRRREIRDRARARRRRRGW